MAPVKNYDLSKVDAETYLQCVKADKADWQRMLSKYPNCINRKEGKKLNAPGKSMAKNQMILLRLVNGDSKNVSQPLKRTVPCRELTVEPGRWYIAFCAADEEIKFVCSKVQEQEHEEDEQEKNENVEKNKSNFAYIKIFTIDERQQATFALPLRIKRDITVILKNNTTVRVVMIAPSGGLEKSVMEVNYSKRIIDQQKEVIQLRQGTALQLTAEVKNLAPTCSIYVLFTASQETRKSTPSVTPGEELQPAQPADASVKFIDTKTLYDYEWPAYVEMEAHDSEELMRNHRKEHRVDFVHPTCKFSKLYKNSMTTIKLNRREKPDKTVSCRRISADEIPREVFVVPGQMYYVVCPLDEVIRFICLETTDKKDAVIKVIALNDQRLQKFVVPFRVQREVTLVVRNGTKVRVVIYPPKKSEAEETVALNFRRISVTEHGRTVETKEYDAFEIMAQLPGLDNDSLSSVYVTFTPSTEERERLSAIAEEFEATDALDISEERRECAIPTKFQTKKWYNDVVYKYANFDDLSLDRYQLLVFAWNAECIDFFTDHRREHKIDVFKLTQSNLRENSITTIRLQSHVAKVMTGPDVPEDYTPRLVTVKPGRFYFVICSLDEALELKCDEKGCDNKMKTRNAIVRIITISDRKLKKWAVPLRVQREVVLVQRNDTVVRVVIYPQSRLASETSRSLQYAKRYITHKEETIETKEYDAFEVHTIVEGFDTQTKSSVYVTLTPSTAERDRLATMESAISSSIHTSPDGTQSVSRSARRLSPLRRRIRPSKDKSRVATAEARIAAAHRSDEAFEDEWARICEAVDQEQDQSSMNFESFLNSLQERERSRSPSSSSSSSRSSKAERPRQKKAAVPRRRARITKQPAKTKKSVRSNRANQRSVANSTRAADQEQDSSIDSSGEREKSPSPSVSTSKSRRRQAQTPKVAGTRKTTRRSKATKTVRSMSSDQAQVKKSQKRKRMGKHIERSGVTRKRSQRSKVKSTLRQQNEQVRASAVNPREYMLEKESQSKEKRKSKVDREIERSRAGIVNPRQFHVQQMQLEQLHSLPSSTITHIEGYPQPSEAPEQPQELTEEEELLRALDTIDNMRNDMGEPRS